MDPDLTILTPENIKLMSFDEHTLKVLLSDDNEVVFEFRNSEGMDKAIAGWAKRSDVISGISGQAKLRFPSGSANGQRASQA